jgi:hypothetical protein
VMALDEFKRIYVESRLNDNHHLDELLAAELQRLGHDASFGPRTMMPANTDAVLTYEDRWNWDFHDYLIELNVELYALRGHKKLAEGRYYQPSITTKAPPAVIHEVLPRMFK